MTTPTVFHILFALSTGKRRGYGIMKQVELDSQRLIGIIKEEITFMTPTFKIFGTIIISAIVAVATLATAWFLKGSAYENAFFYLFAIGLVIIAAFEVYSRKKNPD